MRSVVVRVVMGEEVRERDLAPSDGEEPPERVGPHLGDRGGVVGVHQRQVPRHRCRPHVRGDEDGSRHVAISRHRDLLGCAYDIIRRRILLVTRKLELDTRVS